MTIELLILVPVVCFYIATAVGVVMAVRDGNMRNMKPLSRAVALKVCQIVDAGLIAGVGKPIPGQLCVEAAVSLALGLPHGDNPPCVGEAVREFKIKLNDSRWSSDAARAKGVRKIAVAQLGSNTIDQNIFADLLCLKGVQRILPLIFRALAKCDDCQEKDRDSLVEHAVKCEAVTTVKEARSAAKSAYASASASASASTYTYTSAFWTEALGVDALLILSADICLEALSELKSPGCEWLDVCEMGAK